MMLPKRPTKTLAADVLAIQAFIFITKDEERLSRFMTLTGAEPDQLRIMLKDQNALGEILDYLLSSEPLLMEFAEAQNIDPRMIASARQNLPGAPLD